MGDARFPPDALLRINWATCRPAPLRLTRAPAPPRTHYRHGVVKREETTDAHEGPVHFGRVDDAAEDLDQVNQQFGDQKYAALSAGFFNRVEGDNRTRVTVFASAVSYLQEMPEENVGLGLL